MEGEGQPIATPLLLYSWLIWRLSDLGNAVVGRERQNGVRCGYICFESAEMGTVRTGMGVGE